MTRKERRKRKKQKRYLGYFIVILAILLILCWIPKKKKEEKNATVEVKEKIVEVSAKEEKTNENIKKEVAEGELNDWRLLLINKENKVPEEYNPELAKIEKDMYFDARAIDELKAMISQMREEGIHGVWIQSSYRSIEKQEKLFENKTEQYKQMGYNQEQAESLAQMLVQKPGHSEHNIALSVDFNYVNEEFEHTKAFAWLVEHAADYGFILRYPKDKVEKTGVNYEPWHWRYVGTEYAKEIKQKGYCLEEYLGK